MNKPNLRFNGFTDNWETVKLEDIAHISSGGTPLKSESSYWDGNIPWITTSLINFNYICHSEYYITNIGLSNSSAKIFPINTILMAMYGQGKTRGKVGILKIKATTNQACAGIILKEHNNYYLYQYLSKNYHNIRSLSNNGSQKNLSLTIIKNIKINIPTIEEQEKIGNFLMWIDKQITILEQQKTKLEDYKKTLSTKIFTQSIRFKGFTKEWQTVKLKQCITFISGYAFNSTDFIKNEVSIIKISNIQDNKIILDISNTVSLNLYNTLKKYRLHYNDLVIAMSGATVGKMGIFKTHEKALLNQRVGIIRSLAINQIFLNYIMLTQSKNILSKSYGGAQPNISPKDIEEIKITIPPNTEEQEKIAHILSNIDHLITQKQTHLTQTLKYKTYLLQNMFI